MAFNYNTESALYLKHFVDMIASNIEDNILPFPVAIIPSTAEFQTDVKTYFPVNYQKKKMICVQYSGGSKELETDQGMRATTLIVTIRIYYDDIMKRPEEVEQLNTLTNIVANYFDTQSLMKDSDGLTWDDITTTNLSEPLIFPASGNYGSELTVQATAYINFNIT